MVILGALLAAVAGCSAGPASSAPSASPSVTASPTASLGPSATALPSLPADAAPAELKGRWTTLMGPNDVVLLIVNDSGYSISQGGAANGGHISVVGDQIAFSRVNSCAGTGTYHWAIDANGILTFTPVGDPDPCPRGGFLKGQAYARE
jgi:glucose/arabinose dehydrogenase